jgi:hypothetical protein
MAFAIGYDSHLINVLSKTFAFLKAGVFLFSNFLKGDKLWIFLQLNF